MIKTAKRVVSILTSLILVIGLLPVFQAEALTASKSNDDLTLQALSTTVAKSKADIVFVLDSTGSMDDAIDNVVNTVNDFVS